MIHVKAYGTALYFLSKGLQELSLRHFTKLAEVYWNTSEFLTAVDEVYPPGMDEDIRNAVLDIMSRRPEVLRKDEADNLVKEL